MLKVVVLMMIIYAVERVVESVIYNGTCPVKEFKMHRNFVCADVFGRDKRFKVCQISNSYLKKN